VLYSTLTELSSSSRDAICEDRHQRFRKLAAFIARNALRNSKSSAQMKWPGSSGAG
jgi:hypothetical protein